MPFSTNNYKLLGYLNIGEKEKEKIIKENELLLTGLWK